MERYEDSKRVKPVRGLKSGLWRILEEGVGLTGLIFTPVFVAFDFASGRPNNPITYGEAVRISYIWSWHLLTGKYSRTSR